VTPIIPALRRQRQDGQSLRSVWNYIARPCLKKKKKKKRERDPPYISYQDSIKIMKYILNYKSKPTDVIN
jgi:hypothetical protein